MKARFVNFTFVVMLLAVLAPLACDDDLTRVAVSPLDPEILVGDTIGRQDEIRVVFPRAVDAATALDPANFIVTDLCTGLRIPGSLRLSGDTLIFSASEALPFLTPIAVRIQNILDLNGQSLAAPVTFSTTTEAPPVRDVSWQTLNSPTGDFLVSTSFLNRDEGYIATSGGEVFRTTSGGLTFAARFKDPDIKNTRVRVSTTDTVYMSASASFGGTTSTTAALFRSSDAAVTFSPVFTDNPADMQSIRLRRAGSGARVFVVGNRGRLAAWLFDEATDVVFRFGPVDGQFGRGGDLSPDVSKAVIVGNTVAPLAPPVVGVAYTSVDSGKTFQQIDIGSVPPLINGGFVNNTTALLVGVGSTVLRVDVTSGTVTPLGAAAGIPVTTVEDSLTLRYNLTSVSFAPGGNVGWIVGLEILDRPGATPDAVRGVILMSRDGGLTFTRQAVEGTTALGLGFPTLSDVSALTPDFVTTVGNEGFVAARKADTGGNLAACSFQNEG